MLAAKLPNSDLNFVVAFWVDFSSCFFQGKDLRSRPPFTGVLLGPGPESAPRSAFWAILGTCLGVPQRVLFECFLAVLSPKNAKKHSKSTLWGTPRQVPKIAQKALRGALSGPGPKSTPVNGGRDRKKRPKKSTEKSPAKSTQEFGRKNSPRTLQEPVLDEPLANRIARFKKKTKPVNK